MNFDSTSVTIIATACLGGGIAAIYEAYRQHVAANRIKDTPTSQIGGLTDGYREIKGRIAKGDKKLQSPMTGKQCVYYSFTVAESHQDGDKEILCDKKSTRFYLKDGTGTAALEIDGAELVLDVDHHDKSGSFNAASPKLEAILKRYDKSSKGLLFNKNLKYEETILEVGDELYVLGPAKMVKGSICFKAIRGQSLIVSDKSERDLLQKHDSKSFQFVLAGVVLFIVAAACLANPDRAAKLLAHSNDTAESGAPRNGSNFDDELRKEQRQRENEKAIEYEKAIANLEKKHGTERESNIRGKAIPTSADAVTLIEKLGGSVIPSKRKPVIGVSLPFTQVTDVGLEYLKGLKSLKYLTLSFTEVTDEGLVHIKEMTSLKNLDLASTQVTDEGLVHIKGLANLQSLNLSSLQVTDLGLVHLKGLTSLTSLNLMNTQVTDAGLVHLKDLTSLKKLYLERTPVTTAGVADLSVRITQVQNIQVGR